MNDSTSLNIRQAGNYFIMEDDGFVSKPTLLINKPSKGSRRKIAQKMSNVKWNICDKHFKMLNTKISQENLAKIKDIIEKRSKLHFEMKQIDIDKQTHELEIKKRVDPLHDYSYDERQLATSYKRLGASDVICYLDKRVTFPIRHHLDRCAPNRVVIEAQQRLQSRRKMRSLVASAPSKLTDINTKFAKQDNTEGRLNGCFDNIAPRTDTYVDSQYRNQYNSHLNTGGKQFNLPIEKSDLSDNYKRVNYAMNETSADMPKLKRSKTFTSSKITRGVFDDNTSNGDENLEIYHKLWAKFSRSMHILRSNTQLEKEKKQNLKLPPRIMQKQLEQDSKLIQDKLDTFFTQNFWSNATEYNENVNKEDQDKRVNKVQTGLSGLMSLYNQVLSQTASAVKADDTESNNKTYEMWMEIARKDLESRSNKSRKKSSIKLVLDTNTENKIEEIETEKNVEKQAMKKWRNLTWRITKEGISKQYKGDVSLNRIMGIDVVNRNNHKVRGIPINSALRSLNQSSTYKLRKLVEAVTKSKNKYELQELYEVKQQLENSVKNSTS